GLGLGLAIVRSLVGLHGGTVRLASAGRGLGSEFTVELPALDDEQSVPEEPSTRRIFLNPTTRPRRVLVVDDNADAAQLIADGLRARGDDVRVAGDGLAAIELARSFKPDAAFIDIGLPVMDGYAVASQLRNELGRAVILVAVSGYAEDTSRRASVVAGFDAHLVKPVSLEVLAGILDGRDAVSSADSLNARAGRGS
ncbi:MAG: response regulator, partial [Planctomycetota bacterium]